MTKHTPTPTANRIWTFELFSDESKWYVYANGKKSWEIPLEEEDEAPQVMKRYFDAWDEDEVTL